MAWSACSPISRRHYFATGEVPPRSGNDHPIAAPYGLFPTRDGQIALAPTDDTFFGRLMDALGEPELKSDPLYAHTGRPRRQSRADQRDRRRQARRNTTEHWVATLNKAGVPCGPVYGVAEVFADPQILGQDMAIAVASRPWHGAGCSAFR